MSKVKKIIKGIVKTIIDNTYLKSIFYHKTKNRKYTVQYLLKHVLFILKSGISYRMLSEFPNINSSNAPHWGTVYKFFKKLVKYNIIHDTFKQTVEKYLLKSNNNIFLTDTSLVANKGGCDKKTYNPQLTKHNSTKISSINDIEGKPLDIQLYNSSTYDSKILSLHLDNVNFFKKNNNNILLGDTGYDSNPIRDKLEKIKFGKLIAPKNTRNCKDPILLKTFKLCDKDKKLLKHRIKIENSFAQLKAFKRINIRYDKYSKNFFNYIILAALSFY